uniref:T-complex protein 1 subunit gamma n=1 Tax=Globodera pallida TaxID=36090 RepID=A0A183C236_GLOPA
MMQTGGAPLIIINRMAEREQGHRVQRQNIAAAKLVADVIRTSLGPRAMLKMLMDPMGGIVLTNDGNAILREITVKHPAAKTMIEIARTQDEETGDGTTTVIILAGEFLAQAEQFLEQSIHPTVIIQGFRMALEDIIEWTEEKFCKSALSRDEMQKAQQSDRDRMERGMRTGRVIPIINCIVDYLVGAAEDSADGAEAVAAGAEVVVAAAATATVHHMAEVLPTVAEVMQTEGTALRPTRGALHRWDSRRSNGVVTLPAYGGGAYAAQQQPAPMGQWGGGAAPAAAQPDQAQWQQQQPAGMPSAGGAQWGQPQQQQTVDTNQYAWPAAGAQQQQPQQWAADQF